MWRVFPPSHVSGLLSHKGLVPPLHGPSQAAAPGEEGKMQVGKTHGCGNQELQLHV